MNSNRIVNASRNIYQHVHRLSSSDRIDRYCTLAIGLARLRLGHSEAYQREPQLVQSVLYGWGQDGWLQRAHAERDLVQPRSVRRYMDRLRSEVLVGDSLGQYSITTSTFIGNNR